MQLAMQDFDYYISLVFKKSYSDSVMILEDSLLI